MFGFSFGEIFVLLVVGIVVVGPRKLPEMMRTAGRWVAKLRRMSSDLRSQSGIDELIRIEGLEKEMRELRSLARFNVVENLITPAVNAAERAEASLASAAAVKASAAASARTQLATASTSAPAAATFAEPLRSREYPPIGCDAYDAFPDDATAYVSEDDDAREVADEPAIDDAASPDPRVTASAASDATLADVAAARAASRSA